MGMWQCTSCLKKQRSIQRKWKLNNKDVCNKCRMKFFHSKDASDKLHDTSIPLQETVGEDDMYRQSYPECVPVSEIALMSRKRGRLVKESTTDVHKCTEKRLGEILYDEYVKHINVYATKSCEFCQKLLYPKQTKSLHLNDELQVKIKEFEETFNKQVVTVCGQCHNSLKKKTIPKRFVANGLLLDEIPIELASLSEVELRLVSQVKLHMKIYKLCKGQGQAAMKGLVVHFPQCVEEVIEQLPLTAEQSDIVIVREVLEGLNITKELSIRPEKIYSALSWLKRNNPLYANVEIRKDFNLKIESLMTSEKHTVNVDQIDFTVSQTEPYGWKLLERTNVCILRGKISQSHGIFGRSAGKQCTAMAAAFLCYSKIQDPPTWTTEAIQTILIAGNSLYESRVANAEYLNVEEIEGTMFFFDTISVQITLVENGQYSGYLNKYKGNGLNRLESELQEFIYSTNMNAIMTVNSISLGLIKQNSHLYLTDSHSRGAAGQTAANGSACVLKYSLETAAKQVSQIIHRNCQPQSHTEVNGLDFIFTITSITTDIISENNVEFINVNDFTDAPNTPTVTASVIGPIDFIPPDIETQDLDGTIIRSVGRPLYQSNERNLDLLAFVQLFPRGRFGFNCERSVHITPLDYYQQRVMCSDKRFESSNEFLFYALNECDKARIEDKISICCSLTTENGSSEDGIPPGATNPRFCMSSVRGSSSYWQNFCGDLIAMVCHLGTPTFFLTISFDDLNAVDVVTALYKAENGAQAEPNDMELNDFEFKKFLLNKHPVIAARHFSYRLNKFKAMLLARGEEIFGKRVVDFAYRIEFQARGSPHCHGVLWLEEAPDFNTEEGVVFLEKNVSCSLATPIRNLVQRYQSHRHTKTCFKSASRRCRFGFPRCVSDETEVLEDDHAILNNGGRFVNLKRHEDEANINNYHPVLLELLRCNMDIQPVTSNMAIVFYISKYMSKSEPQELRAEVQESIKSINDSSANAREKLRKIANVIMRQREISAQEAAFRVCSLSLRHCSRKTVFVPTFPKEERLRMIRKTSFDTGSVEFGINIIDRYIARPDILDSISLYEFAAHFEPKYYQVNTDEDILEQDVEESVEDGRGIILTLKNGKGKIKKRKLSAAVKVIRFNPDTSPHKYFYSMILLFYPFREENFCDLMDAPEFFKNNYQNFRKHSDDSVIRPELMQQIDSALLHFPIQEEENATVSPSSFIFEEDEIEMPAFDNFPVITTLDRISSLNSDQRKVFDLVASSCRSGDPLKFVCIGAGGCGKSFLIETIADFINTYYNETNCLLISAPTGKAAFNVGGITIHKAFHLSVEHGSLPPYTPLSSNKLHQFRSLYRNVKWVILDELSMVNYETLRTVHLRLGELLGSDEPFGNISFLLFGDLMQLRPVRGSWIFKKPEKFGVEIHLWNEFKFFELTVNQRQVGSDGMLEICNRLRVGKLTLEDIELLQKKLLKPSNPNYNVLMEKFKDAVWIFNTHADVIKHNQNMTEKLKKTSTVYVIKSRDYFHDGGKRHGRPVIEKERFISKKEDKCGGIPEEVEVGIGSRVMVRRNICVKLGIVNGATGTVKEIKWPALRRQPLDQYDMPESISIEFDHKVRGTTDNIYRIKPMSVEFIGKRQTRIQRKQLPIILAWAINTHKVQGMTCPKAVIDLGKSLFTKGMAYVLLSRGKTLEGIAISNLDISKLITTDKFTPCDVDALAELERIRKIKNN